MKVLSTSKMVGIVKVGIGPVPNFIGHIQNFCFAIFFRSRVNP